MKKQKANREYFTTPLVVLYLVIVLVIIGLYFVIAQQQTPYASRSVVFSQVSKIVPEVSGHITKMHSAQKRQFLKKGEMIFQINPKPYQLKYDIAKSELSLTKSDVQKLKLEISNLKDALIAQQATVTRANQDFSKQSKLYKLGSISLQALQHSAASRKVAMANLDQAKVALKQAEAQLGTNVDGQNVHIRKAQAALKLAKYYLDHTTVRAPDDGYFENLFLHKGDYVSSTGTTVPFILAHHFWVIGLVPENSVSNLKPGQKTLVVIDLYPGHIFTGQVESIGHGIQVNAIKPTNNLPEYSNSGSWFSAQQLFPFAIKLDPNQLKGKTLRVGATAHVVVLKNDWSMWNGLAYFVMWLKSLWAYV